MNEDREDVSVLGRLLWPDQQPVSDTDRERADARISSAYVSGVLTEEEANARHAQLPVATTQADLHAALRGLPGVAPASLLIARRVVTALWLAVCAVQITIWALSSLIAWHLNPPWFLWTLGFGGVLVGGLWWISESVSRNRGVKT